MDYTGCGNTLNMPPPRAAADHGLAALLGEEMHVDGFRFDLAPAWPAKLHEVDRLSAPSST
jgi:isoamylase